MAEYDKGRLYWIKLTDRFISSDTVDFLMSQKEGANYVVLYQMLCLKTVNNGGVLARELGEMLVPYDVEKIQRDCKWFSIDTVRIALELYKRLGLIYENNDGILAISDFDRLIGSQTYGAEKKALQRQRQENNLLQGGQVADICPPEKEIEKDKEKEQEKEKEKEYHSFIHSNACEENKGVDNSWDDGADPQDPFASPKLEYIKGTLGEGYLLMSEVQFNDLCDKLSLDELHKYCSVIVECEKNGKHYKKKSHYQAILDMAMRDRKKIQKG